MVERRVTLAVVAGAHGIGGEVRLKLFAESLKSFGRFKAFEADGRSLTLKSVREGPNGAIARFAEIADRTAAEALRGAELSVPREALPPLDEGEYYHADLIGLPCLSDAGAVLGEICAIYDFGASDVFEIEMPDGSKFMVPKSAVEIDDNHVRVNSDFIEQD